MYDPRNVTEYTQKQYRGNERAPVQKTFAISSSGKVRVERPLNYIMRANPDMQASLDLLSTPTDHFVERPYILEGQSGSLTGRPHVAAPKALPFGLVSCTDQIQYTPEGSSDHYESKPQHLHELAGIMCHGPSYSRCSKARPLSALYQLGAAEPQDLLLAAS